MAMLKEAASLAILDDAPPGGAAYEFAEAAPVAWDAATGPPKPQVPGALTFIGGVKAERAGEVVDVTFPIVDAATGKRAVIGSLAQLTPDEAVAAARACSAAAPARSALKRSSSAAMLGRVRFARPYCSENRYDRSITGARAALLASRSQWYCVKSRTSPASAACHARNVGFVRG